MHNAHCIELDRLRKYFKAIWGLWPSTGFENAFADNFVTDRRTDWQQNIADKEEALLYDKNTFAAQQAEFILSLDGTASSSAPILQNWRP